MRPGCAGTDTMRVLRMSGLRELVGPQGLPKTSDLMATWKDTWEQMGTGPGPPYERLTAWRPLFILHMELALVLVSSSSEGPFLGAACWLSPPKSCKSCRFCRSVSDAGQRMSGSAPLCLSLLSGKQHRGEESERQLLRAHNVLACPRPPSVLRASAIHNR